jgi:hypothetical protein
MQKAWKYPAALLFFILVIFVFFEVSSTASVVTKSSRLPVRVQTAQLSQEQRARDLARIIGVLESRIKNHLLSEKAKNKLASMNDKNIRLIESLCERMDKAGDTASADFAFLLVTAAIVTS